LESVVADEAAEVLLLDGAPSPVPGREDALDVATWGPPGDVLGLRTAVAAFLVLRFDVPRPKSLTSGDHLSRIVDAMYTSLRVGSSSSFRFEAAGSDSAVFARLADLLAEATGLRYDEKAGELVVRVRRGVRPGPSGDPGWDVLVRLGARPLSARRWRVTDYPGAVNATIAAAMVRLAEVREQDRVLNLMCGSGTLLVERLTAGPAAEAVGVDLSADALTVSSENLGAGAVDARLERADCTGPALVEAVGTGWDLLLADPPWGTLHGTHATNAEVHAGMLQAAYDAAAPGARFVVLTHEVKVMERCLRDADALWRVRSTTRVFAKGHHPRIYVLDRT
jgi:predicted RNA methylase